jgi:peptidoglycan/xylan/chitin deacetylase (PgdA/CDA1 family)
MGQKKKMDERTVLTIVALCLVILIGIAAIIVGAVSFINMDKNNNSSNVDIVSVDSNTSSNISSEEQTSSEGQTSSKEQTSSQTQTSSEQSTSKDTPSFQVPVTVGLPEADDNPFENPPSNHELVCYLTFDDGPCANTDKILKILNENDVKATFFVVGTMSTGKIRNIYEAGHAIGLHTNTHELSKSNSKYVYKNYNSFLSDLKGISDVLYERTGIRSNLTRFPGGSATAKQRLGTEVFEQVKSTLKEKGYTYFDWNIDSGDTHKASPSKEYVMNEIRSGLRKNGELKSEVCILMHDIKNVTVQVLPDVIKELKELGYTFKRLDSNCDNFAFY